ncbi:unnamed protein product [Lactuca virosa]|uniref:Uncharacterized protein n=1 Tax=Lactuca virosa TaxID=75947 RepID=A0AAU9MV08_9ASTR|nr:unnamed protein product [Lactuca virosa]
MLVTWNVLFWIHHLNETEGAGKTHSGALLTSPFNVDDLKDQLDNIESNTNTFTTISILEARLKMVEDVEKNRVDSLDKTKWEQDLKKFKGDE